MRGAVREAGRALKLNRTLIDSLSKHLPAFSGPGGVDHALQTLPEVARLAGKEPVKTLLSKARRIEGLIHNSSVHASGVVVSGRDLSSCVPLKRGGGGEVVTQYDQESLAFLGLHKLDLLGLRNLTIIDDTLRLLNSCRGLNLSLQDIPLDDPVTFDLLSRGDTLGCFQLESLGIRRLLKRLKPVCLDDIISLLSLYRPGPWCGGVVEAFLRRRRGEEKVDYPHPKLKEILDETYGIVLYQEQIMKIAHLVAGFSLGEADLLRRAITSRNRVLVEQYRQKFFEGAIKKGYKKVEIEKIFDLITKFSGYSFNKAHSASYAYLSYYTAYLKANFTPYYLASLMSTGTGYYGPGVYVQDGLRMGVNFLPPDINLSKHCFTVEENGVRAGLGTVKGVGMATVLAILESRLKEGPFKSLYDFCFRVRISKKAVENLILVGAFDSFGITRPTLLASLDRIMEAARRSRLRCEAGQLSLLENTSGKEGCWPGDAGISPVSSLPEFSRERQLQLEKEILGYYLTGHPLALQRAELARLGVLPI
ncbi:MAG: DNA polymerase III subunit alpha, partial [Desulfofundulus sp.]